MKKNYSLFFLFGPIFLFQTNYSPKIVLDDDEIWSGTVKFTEKQTGKEIEISEWKMETSVVNNKGKAVHSFQFKSKGGTIIDCKNQEETILSVGIGYIEKKYSIEVPMPGCYGTQTTHGNTIDYAKSDETAITINDQPLKNPEILEGTLTETSFNKENGTATTTTYTWNLTRAKKKIQSITQKPRPSQPPVTQPYKKEKWSGLVTWSSTSRSVARIKEETVTSQWDDFFLFNIRVEFINGKGAVLRNDKTTKWRLDSIDFVKKGGREMVEEKTTTIFCDGKEDMQLEILYSYDRKYYWVSFFTPGCPENSTYDVKNNIHGNTHTSSITDRQGGQLTLPANATGYPVGNNPNLLIGTWDEIIPAPNDPGGGKITSRAAWNLKKVN